MQILIKLCYKNINVRIYEIIYFYIQLTISVAAPGFWLEGEDIENDT